MKLEYIENGSDDWPLIRLFDFAPTEAHQLWVVCTGLASGTVARVEIHGLPHVESVGGCRLTFVLRSWDQCVVRRPGSLDFECGLTAGRWDDQAALIEPFCRGASRFQWLADGPGEASLLLSPSGDW